MTHKIQFSLGITPDQYRSYYHGSAKFVHVQAEDGRSLQFPASELQRFVTHTGIQGRFEIEFSDENKLLGLNRIE